MEILVLTPETVFGDEWQGWAAFLGNGKTRRSWRLTDTWVQEAERLAAEHGGILPCRKWLENNGYGGLASHIRREPKLYAHVVQDKARRSEEEWVPVAETLAAKHGGVLPCVRWLSKNKFYGLYKATKKHPELFVRINQERRDKTSQVTTPWEATYDADDPTKPKGCKITQRTNADAA